MLLRKETDTAFSDPPVFFTQSAHRSRASFIRLSRRVQVSRPSLSVRLSRRAEKPGSLCAFAVCVFFVNLPGRIPRSVRSTASSPESVLRRAEQTVIDRRLIGYTAAFFHQGKAHRVCLMI